MNYCPSPIPAHYRTLPYGLVQPAQIVPACTAGDPHVVIAKQLGLSHVTVGKWRRRFFTTRAWKDVTTNGNLDHLAPMMTSGWPK